MGKTSFSGPVFGGEQILGQGFTESLAASASATEFYEVLVPADEDWYATRAQAYCTLAGNAGVADIKDDGTSVLPSTIALTAAAAVNKDVTADPGEYSGKRIAAASVVTFHGTNGTTTAATHMIVTLYGYKRKLPVS